MERDENSQQRPPEPGAAEQSTSGKPPEIRTPDPSRGRSAQPAPINRRIKPLTHQARSQSPGAAVGRLLPQVIGAMPAGLKVRESLALAYWPQVVGKQGAAATEVEAVRDGVLWVRTKSSVWSHELTLHKAKLIGGLNDMLGGSIIHDLKFRAKGLNKRPEPELNPVPDAAELELVTLEPPEESELQSRITKLRSIVDENIRKSIAIRLTAEAKLRHWRLENGWRLCPRCSAAHDTPHRLCPLCRLTNSG